MDYLTAIAQINRKAGGRRDVDRARDALTEAIEELETLPVTPWFLLSEMTHTNTVVGDSRIKVPGDFIKGYEEGELFGENEDGSLYPLVKGSLDQLITNTDVTGYDTDRPLFYAFTGQYYRLFPVPTGISRIKMIYYRKSDIQWLDGNGDPNPSNRNMWLIKVSKLVIAKAAMNLMEVTRDEKGLTIQKKVYDAEWTKLMIRDTEMREINLTREFGLN